MQPNHARAHLQLGRTYQELLTNRYRLELLAFSYTCQKRRMRLKPPISAPSATQQKR
jgi:hypothetical protein